MGFKNVFEVLTTIRVSFNSKMSSRSRAMLSRQLDTTVRAKLQELSALDIVETHAKLVDGVYDALKKREEVEAPVLISLAFSFFNISADFAQLPMSELAKKLRLTDKAVEEM